MAIKRVVLCKDCSRSHEWVNADKLVYCDYWDVMIGKKAYCIHGEHFKRTKWQKRDVGYMIQERIEENEN